MILRRAVVAFLVVLLSCESFADIVGDNDGAAFVTKKEFEDLQLGFAAQIDKYNTSIDEKIDGAIANYLDGIKISKRLNGEFDSSTNYKFPLVMIGPSIDWTNPKDTNDYYMLARPRLRLPVLTLQGFTENAYNTGVADKFVTWNSSTDTAILTVTPYGGAANVFGFLLRECWDLPGKTAVLNEVSQTSNVRQIGSTNYKIFDLANYGKGYQYFDYKPIFSVTAAGNAGHFATTKTNCYAYFGILGTTFIGNWQDGVKVNPGNNPINITESQIKGTGAGYNNETIYNQRTSSYLGTKVKVQNIPEWNWHGGAAIDAVNKPIDSANFIWDEVGKKSVLYARTANMPAEMKGKFALQPDWTDGLNTIVEAIDIQPWGHSLGFAYNCSSADRTDGHWLARGTQWIPPFKPVIYNGYSTINSFSALPASCVRYSDSLGNEHFMDEGMFIRNFDSNCSVDFDLLFQGKTSAVKNFYFYVSKKPFDRNFTTTQRLSYKWVQGSSSGTSTAASIKTGTKFSIHIDDILKGEQLYFYWEPVTSTDYITLNEVQKFIIEEE